MADEPTNEPTQDEELNAPSEPEQDAPADAEEETATTTTGEADEPADEEEAVDEGDSPVLGDQSEDPLEHGRDTALRNSA